MNLVELIDRYNSDDTCRAALERLRWPVGVACLRCGDMDVNDLGKHNRWECRSCHYQFSVTAGTIMHDSHLPLRKWFLAIYLMCESKKGMSANQLKRTLGVSSWLNLVERFFSELTTRRPKRLAVTSVDQLIEAINHYIDRRNDNPTPFVWTASAQSIIAKVSKAKETLATQH